MEPLSAIVLIKVLLLTSCAMFSERSFRSRHSAGASCCCGISTRGDGGLELESLGTVQRSGKEKVNTFITELQKLITAARHPVSVLYCDFDYTYPRGFGIPPGCAWSRLPSTFPWSVMSIERN